MASVSQQAMMASYAGGGASPVSAMAFVASAVGNGATISIPAAAQAGDYCILIDFAGAVGSVPTEIRPTGFDLVTPSLSYNLSVGYRIVISQRVLGAGEASTSIAGMTGAASTKAVLVFRPTGSLSSATPNTWSGELDSGNPSPQVVSASGQATPLIVFGVILDGDSATTPAFSTETPAFDGTVTHGTQVGLRAGYKIYNSGPANHTIDMGDLGNANTMCSGFVRFA